MRAPGREPRLAGIARLENQKQWQARRASGTANTDDLLDAEDKIAAFTRTQRVRIYTHLPENRHPPNLRPQCAHSQQFDITQATSNGVINPVDITLLTKGNAGNVVE